MSDFYTNIPWEMIAKVLSGEADAPTTEQLNIWAAENSDNQALLIEIESLWNHSANYQVAITESKNLDMDAAWKKIHQSVEQNLNTIQISKGPSFIRRYSARIAAAAAIFVVLSLSAYWAMPYLTGKEASKVETKWLAVSNELNEPKTILMPDGSNIVLNTGTSLRYPERFDPRLVELKGEAFFEVAKDEKRPFEVRFGLDNQVTVLGTSFNIRAYEGDEKVSVAVSTGKVAFKAAKLDKIELSSGEAISYNNNNTQLTKKTDLNANAWKTQVLNFNNDQLKEVLLVLEHHFQAKFEIDNPSILNCRFKGIYEKATLENIMQAISFTLELDIKSNDNVYYISGQGCEVN